MKQCIAVLLLLTASAVAQISGAGQLSCSGATVTGTAITSATSNNTVLVSLAGTPAYGMLVQLDQTATVTGGAVTFQVSSDGGANYIAAPVAQVLNPSTGAQLTNPYTLVASTNQTFLVVLAGASTFQVKLTTAMTGTGTITPYVTPLCTQPTLGPLVPDSSGNLKVNLQTAVPAGANVIGHVIADSGSTTAVTGNVAVTKADGSDVTLGAKADAKNTATDTTAISVMQVLKEISAMEQAPASRAVTGIFWQATQPISAASLPLPTGAAQDSSLTTLDTDVKANVTLHAGANLVGKVGIDQTTPGTTNAVAATNLPTTVDTNSGTKSASTIRVVLATDQPQLTNKLLVTPDSVALPANQSVNVNQVAGASTGATNPLYTAVADGTTGPVAVKAASTQAAAADKSFVVQLNPNQPNLTTPLNANPVPSTSSTFAFAAAPYSVNATSTSTYTNVKASAGNVYGFDVVNPNASTCWIQFYNSATPTVGTSVIFAVPILTSGGGFKNLPFPVNFSTAISIATTTTATGSTECATGMGLVLYYQ